MNENIIYFILFILIVAIVSIVYQLAWKRYCIANARYKLIKLKIKILENENFNQYKILIPFVDYIMQDIERYSIFYIIYASKSNKIQYKNNINSLLEPYIKEISKIIYLYIKYSSIISIFIILFFNFYALFLKLMKYFKHNYLSKKNIIYRTLEFTNIQLSNMKNMEYKDKYTILNNT